MSELKEQIEEAVRTKPYFEALVKGTSFCAQLAAKDREIAAFEAEKKRVLATLETVAKQRDEARVEIAALQEALRGMLHTARELLK